MRFSTRQCFAVIMFVVTLLVNSTQAQTSSVDQSTPSALAKGTHPLGNYGGSNFDNVNLFNGNLSITLPLASSNGRKGLGVSVVLSYNSKIWRVEEHNIQGDIYHFPVRTEPDPYLPNIAPGWTLHAGRMLGRPSHFFMGTTGVVLTTLSFTAPDGAEYEFRDDLTDGQPQSTLSFNRGKNFHTADGSAATFISDTDILDPSNTTSKPFPFRPSGVVILRDGTRYRVIDGHVTEQQDRNGNKVRFEYNGQRVIAAVDTLGRRINLTYFDIPQNPVGEFSLINIDYLGVNGVTRTIQIMGSQLQHALRDDYTLLTDRQLFPGLDDRGTDDIFNPVVIKNVTLPSTHQWVFAYNSHAETVRVETPARGAIEYEMAETQVISTEIFRRITVRRTYPDATLPRASFEGRTTYTDPSQKDGNGNPLPVFEKHFNNSGTLLATTRHQFAGTPIDNYGIGVGAPDNTGYKPWMEGKTTQVAELAADGTTPIRIIDYTWEQRTAVGWVTSDPTALNQPENDPRLVKTRTTLVDVSPNLISEVVNTYDGYNNILTEKVYDFGSGVVGSLIKETIRTYVTTLNGKNYRTDTSVHLRSLVATETIKNGTGQTETETQVEYDNYSSDGFHAPLLSRVFDPLDQSRNTNYNSAYIWRGNATAVTKGFGTPDAATSYTQFDIAGNAVKTVGSRATSGSIDPHSVRIEYDVQFNYAYPTKTIQCLPGTNCLEELTTTTAYDRSTGLVTSRTGFNGDTTTYQYLDALDRVTKETRPLGYGETNYIYSSPGLNPSFVQTQIKLQGATYITSTGYFDGLLRSVRQTRNDATPGVDVITESRYDGLGRAYLISNPHRLTQAATDGWTRTNFDSLGRVVKVASYANESQALSEAETDGFTGKVTTQYSGTTLTVTDQAGKQRKSVADALGRLTDAYEPTAAGALTLRTQYGYDARSNLLSAIQYDGASPPNQQNRNFVYDALGRLISASTPEGGTVTYTYDKASNLLSRTDARGVVTNYTYDELNRILTKSYTNSPIVTPSVTHYYDKPTLIPGSVQPPPDFFIGSFSLGRLIAVVTNETSAKGNYYAYDQGGRVSKSNQLLDNTFYQSSTTYNEASLPLTETYPSTSTVAIAYNTAGQIASINRNGMPLSTVQSYSATGAVEAQKFGNFQFHTISYNARLQPKTISLGITAGGSEKLRLAYDYGLWNSSDGPGSALDQKKNNGNVGRITITPGTGLPDLEQNFEYDELNRIKLAKEFSQSGTSVINTIAGNGTAAYSGDGGPATAASLSAPGDVAVASNGDIYIADTENNVIRKINASTNTITTVIGNGTYASTRPNFGVAASGQPIGACYGLAVDPSGNLYFTDADFGYLAKIDTSGILTMVADLNFHYVMGIAYAPDGSIYVTDIDDSVVWKVQGGTATVFAGNGTDGYSGDGGPATSAQLSAPTGVALDSAGNVYIADWGNWCARKVNTSGIITTIAGSPNNTGYSGDGGPAVNAAFLLISDIAVDAAGVVYLSDYQNARYRKIFTSGIVDTFAGTGVRGYSGDGGSPTNAQVSDEGPFGFGTGIALDSSGNIYIADGYNHRVRKITGGVGASWTQTFAYDRYGNRTDIPISQTNNRINAANYQYDAAGNLTQAGTGITYSYDAENRMVTATINNITSTYTYDGQGRRVKKVVNGIATRFVYDSAGNLIAEYDGANGNLNKEYVYGATGLLAIIESASIKYATPDHLGSPRIWTNEIGSVVSRHDYFPFGEEIGTGIGGRSTGLGYGAFDGIRQKFTGYERDNETGLDFAQARYYGSNFGRFNSPDPIYGMPANPKTWNRYTYGLNNPLRFVDPTGLFSNDALEEFLQTGLSNFFTQGVIIDLDEVIYEVEVKGEPLTAFERYLIDMFERDPIEYDPELQGFAGPGAYFMRFSHLRVTTSNLVARQSLKQPGKGYYAVGRPVPPLERTLEHALDPDGYLNDVAKKYGINLKGSGEEIKLVYDPTIPAGSGILGKTLEREGGKIVTFR